MESSIRGNLFFILYSVEHGNLILYYDYPVVRMTVTQYTTTLQEREEFRVSKKIREKGCAFRVANEQGQLGHLQRELVAALWPVNASITW